MARKKSARPAAIKKPRSEAGSVFLTNEWLMGDVELKYADNLILRFQDRTFQLMFFQQQVPAVFGTAADMKKQLEASGVMENVCVARLVVSEPKMGVMIDAMRRKPRSLCGIHKEHGAEAARTERSDQCR